MARIPNTATKEERRIVHEAKMAGKMLDRARRRPTVAIRRNFGLGSIARVNRHTGKPHEHARQTARIARQTERDEQNRRDRGIVFAAGYRFVMTRRNLMQVEA